MEPNHRPEIRDVLARTDLAALLDALAPPATHTTRGRKWHCPVSGHDDRHPSVTMYTDRRGHQRWRCWSGDEGHRGDALDLVIVVRHLSRRDAIDWLANRVDHAPAVTPPRPRATTARPDTTIELDPAVVTYAQRCAQLLWTAKGAPIRRWLYRRGFSDDVLRVNQIGADPGRCLVPRPRGLPAGNGLAATFAALDPDGVVRYVQTRYLVVRPGQPKYDNPASRHGTNPRLAWLRPPVPRFSDLLVVCEGIPDALTAAQAGFAAVALLGTHAADERCAAQLADHATQHSLAPIAIVDADPAGREAGERLARLLDHHGVKLSIIEPPDGLDLNGWALRDPAWRADLVRHDLHHALKCRAAYSPDRDHHEPAAWIVEVNDVIRNLEAELDDLRGRSDARLGKVAPRRSPTMDL